MSRLRVPRSRTDERFYRRKVPMRLTNRLTFVYCMVNEFRWTVATLAALIFAGNSAADTVLTFDPAASFTVDGAPPVGYGNNVSSPTQGGFSYGGAADTPNVTVDFTNLVFANPTLFGDL